MLFDPEENSDYFKAVPPGCMDPNATNYNPDATINDGSCQQLTITVISPNGDEEWQIGSTYTITWDSSGLSRYQGLNPLSSDYIVKVGDYDPSNNKKIKSKNLFSESVKINKLLQNENINLDRVKITENTQNNIIPLSSNFPSSYVNIKLYRSSDSSGSYTYHQTISTATSNDGSYNWAISSSLSESYYYKIRIEDYYDSSDYDESDSYFTLSSSLLASLQIQNVVVDSNNTGTLDIYISNSIAIGGFQFELLGITVTNAYGGLAGGNDYLLSDNSNIVIGYSITDTSIPMGSGILVQISFSNYSGDEICFGEDTGSAGETAIADADGNYIAADWGDCYGSTAVSGCTDLDACNYDEVATEDDGSCLYNDCAGICGGSSTIDNCDVCGGDNADMDCVGVCGGSAVEDCAGECGGSAEVDECGVCGGDGSSCGSALQIISPNGGENWNKSGSYTIQWQSGSSDTHVHLEIWKGGSKYQDIYYYLDNSGSYSWYISPAYPSGNDYQIKVIGWQSGLSDLSNNNFTIY